MLNKTWQWDFTCRLSERTDTEILAWLEDCVCCALSITARRAVTTPIVLATLRSAVATHAIAALTLTDNGMVFTTGLSGIGRIGGRNVFEAELRRLNITQKSSRSGHPTIQGKIERFQQRMKNWLRAANPQPSTVAELQQLLEQFADHYNNHRPHRLLAHRAPPAMIYQRMPKATPTDTRDTDTHERARQDRVENADSITLRAHAPPHHISIRGTHARTPVIIHTHDPTSESSTPQPENCSASQQPTKPGTTSPKTKETPEPVQIQEPPMPCEITTSG